MQFLQTAFFFLLFILYATSFSIYDSTKEHPAEGANLPTTVSRTRVSRASPHPNLDFSVRPNTHVTLSNDTGVVLPCGGTGSHPVTVQWMDARDGTTLTDVPGLLSILSNGSVSIHPFSPSRFDPSIHSGELVCVLSSELGSLRSVPVKITTVMASDYHVDTFNEVSFLRNNVLIGCRVSPASQSERVAVTSWSKNGERTIFPGDQMDRKHYLDETGTLHILSVSPSDGHSYYQCSTVDKLTGQLKQSSNKAKIIVNNDSTPSTPRFSSSLRKFSTKSVKGGEKVTLSCGAQGNPPPSYSWKKDGFEIVFDSYKDEERSWLFRRSISNSRLIGGSLVLEEVKQEDAGVYSCTASNSEGTATIDVQLEVKSALAVKVSPKFREVKPLERLLLECSVKKGDPLNLLWYRNGKLIRPGDRVDITPSGSLIISSVHADTDTGVYQCEVTDKNMEKYTDHAIVTLRVSSPKLLYQFIAHTLQPGHSVNLKCIASGSPTPAIHWKLDGFALPQNHRILIGQYVSSHGDVISHVNITSVHVYDGGVYECGATNRIGSVTHSARLNVYGAPMVRPMGEMTALAGESFEVMCPVGGYPIERIVWSKDLTILPNSHRHLVKANGTLRIDEVEAEDAGSYSCEAHGRQGESDRNHMLLRVVVPPRLGPLFFPPNTRAGMRVRVSCYALEGDLPLEIVWMKDNYPLLPSKTVKISKSDSYATSLLITDVKAQDSGNYTCRASNTASTVTTTAVLAVNVPPTWLQEPTDFRVVRNDSASIPCSAEGFPEATIEWSRETGSSTWSKLPITKEVGQSWLRTTNDLVNGDFTEIAVKPTNSPFSSVQSGLFSLSNGTLLVQMAQKMHQGRYICKATNGVGAGLSKIIDLKINEPPWFRDTSKFVEVEVGLSATLTCNAHGDSPLALTWRTEGEEITTYGRYIIEQRDDADGSQTLTLTIEDVEQTDSGEFVCEASNSHGYSTYAIMLVVEDVPSVPIKLKILHQTSRSITISWKEPSRKTSSVTSYVIAYRREGEKEGVEIQTKDTTFEITNLSPHQLYKISVAAQNRIGRSGFSSAVRHATDEEKPQGKPTNLRISNVSPQSITVDWDHPDPSLSNGRLLGYYLGIKERTSSKGLPKASYNFTTIGIDLTQKDRSLQTHFTVENLRPYTSYAIAIQAFNSKGAGPSSEDLTATTKEDKPSVPPTNIRCDSISSSSIEIKWDQPETLGTNGVITHYRVHYELNNKLNEQITATTVESGVRLFTYGSDSTKHGRGGTRTTNGDQHYIQISGLLADRNYSAAVSAATVAGEGIRSEEISCQTKEDVPDAPKEVKAVASSSRTVLVSWTAPVLTRGKLTQYTVYWTNNNNQSTPQKLRVNPEYLDALLMEMTQFTYTIWVTASTSVGEGEKSSSTSVSVTPKIMARIASIGGVKPVIHKSDVRLQCKNVGEPRPILIWAKNNRDIYSNDRVSVLRDGSLRILSVSRKDKGNYTCQVSNIHGKDILHYELIVLVPPSPPVLHITQSTPHSIKLQWRVKDFGGTPVDGYTLYYRVSGGDTMELALSDSVFTVGNLTCGTKYYFFATSRNIIGSSKSSEVIEGKTKGERPIPAPEFQFITTNNTQVTLYLTQWKDGGCPISHYSIEYRVRDGSTRWNAVHSKVSPVRTYGLRGLKSANTYQLRVTGYNSAGSTTALYSVNIPSTDENAMETVWHEEDQEGRFSLWKDLRVVIPTSLSFLILLLTVIKFVLCTRHNSSNSNKKSQLKNEEEVQENDKDAQINKYEENTTGLSYENYSDILHDKGYSTLDESARGGEFNQIYSRELPIDAERHHLGPGTMVYQMPRYLDGAQLNETQYHEEMKSSQRERRKRRASRRSGEMSDQQLGMYAPVGCQETPQPMGRGTEKTKDVSL